MNLNLRKYNYSGLSDGELKKVCECIYKEIYVNGSFRTKDGYPVIFRDELFWKLFSYESYKLGARVFSYQRARAVLWIKQAIQECYGFERMDYKKMVKGRRSRRYKERKRRYYFCRVLKYVVILDREKDKFVCISHYFLKDLKRYKKMVKLFGLKRKSRCT